VRTATGTDWHEFVHRFQLNAGLPYRLSSLWLLRQANSFVTGDGLLAVTKTDVNGNESSVVVPSTAKGTFDRALDEVMETFEGTHLRARVLETDDIVPRLEALGFELTETSLGMRAPCSKILDRGQRDNGFPVRELSACESMSEAVLDLINRNRTDPDRDKPLPPLSTETFRALRGLNSLWDPATLLVAIRDDAPLAVLRAGTEHGGPHGTFGVVRSLATAPGLSPSVSAVAIMSLASTAVDRFAAAGATSWHVTVHAHRRRLHRFYQRIGLSPECVVRIYERVPERASGPSARNQR
jgi:hypothetical protein